MEVFEIPADKQDELSWHIDLGVRYWLNTYAKLIDPLMMLAHHQEQLIGEKAEIVPFEPERDHSGFRGFTYPLSCSEEH